MAAAKFSRRQIIVLILLAAAIFLIGFFGVQRSPLRVRPIMNSSENSRMEKPDIWLEDFFGSGKSGKGNPKKIRR